MKTFPKSVKVFTDGASRGNPGLAAIGVSICDDEESELDRFGLYIGRATNNEAEYAAVIHALRYLSAVKVEKVVLATDSELVARQIEGKYKTKEPRMADLKVQVDQLSSCFREFKIINVPRSNNVRADEIANEVLDMHAGKKGTGEALF